MEDDRVMRNIMYNKQRLFGISRGEFNLHFPMIEIRKKILERNSKEEILEKMEKKVLGRYLHIRKFTGIY